LRQVSIGFIQPLDLLLNKLLNQALRIAICEVYLWVQLLRILHRASSAKSKDNGWQQIHLLNRQQCLLKIGFLLTIDILASACARPLASTLLHVLRDDLLHGVLLGFDGFFLEVDFLPLVGIIGLLLLAFLLV